MSDPLPIEAARLHFVNEIRKSDYIPDTAELSIFPTGGDIAIIHCCWPMVEGGLKSYSREIMVQISSSAMARFCAATQSGRDAMVTGFHAAFNRRMAKYNPKTPSPPAFRVVVELHDLES